MWALARRPGLWGRLWGWGGWGGGRSHLFAFASSILPPIAASQGPGPGKPTVAGLGPLEAARRPRPRPGRSSARAGSQRVGGGGGGGEPSYLSRAFRARGTRRRRVTAAVVEEAGRRRARVGRPRRSGGATGPGPWRPRGARRRRGGLALEVRPRPRPAPPSSLTRTSLSRGLKSPCLHTSYPRTLPRGLHSPRPLLILVPTPVPTVHIVHPSISAAHPRGLPGPAPPLAFPPFRGLSVPTSTSTHCPSPAGPQSWTPLSHAHRPPGASQPRPRTFLPLALLPPSQGPHSPYPRSFPRLSTSGCSPLSPPPSNLAHPLRPPQLPPLSRSPRPALLQHPLARPATLTRLPRTPLLRSVALLSAPLNPNRPSHASTSLVTSDTPTFLVLSRSLPDPATTPVSEDRQSGKNRE